MSSRPPASSRPDAVHAVQWLATVEDAVAAIEAGLDQPGPVAAASADELLEAQP